MGQIFGAIRLQLPGTQKSDHSHRHKALGREGNSGKMTCLWQFYFANFRNIFGAIDLKILEAGFPGPRGHIRSKKIRNLTAVFT